MSFFTLHGFFERIYRNETPLLAYLWLPLHEFLYTTWSSLHVYTGMKRLWWLVFSLHYMRSITPHELFACVYWNETPLMAGLLFWLHETNVTTWIFEAYIGKNICWLVYRSDYMSSHWLHGFLKHMLAKASAGWSIACTTWVSFTLHGFFECIYRNQTTSWPISDLHYMRSITLHELFARVYWNETPLTVCWMVYSLHYMSFFTLHGFFECIYRNETSLLANLWLPLHEFLYTTWTFCTCIVEWNACNNQKHLLAGL